MLRLFQIALFTMMLAPSVGKAQDFDKGQAAAIAGDYATALREFRLLAEQGHTGAQRNLGAMHGMGHGVPQDHAEGARWYRRAAGLGDAQAQNTLGMAYNLGLGVPRNYITAHMWYNLAASQGNERAAFNRKEVA